MGGNLIFHWSFARAPIGATIVWEVFESSIFSGSLRFHGFVPESFFFSLLCAESKGAEYEFLTSFW